MELKEALESLEYVYLDVKTKRKLSTQWYDLKKTTKKDIEENKPEGSKAYFRDNKFRLCIYLD